MKMGDLPIDRELASLLRDIRSLSPPPKSPLAQQEAVLVQQQARLLERHVEFMSIHEVTRGHLQESVRQAGGAEDSVALWNGVLLDKLFQVYEMQNQLLRRQLWVGVLTARINFFEGYLPKWVEDEEALLLGQRRNVQDRAESTLAKRLAFVRKRRGDIKRQMDEITVGVANRDAAGTLDCYFGEGSLALWNHPYMAALQLFLKKATLPARLGRRYGEMLRAAQGLEMNSQELKSRVKRGLFSRFARTGATKSDFAAAGGYSHTAFAAKSDALRTSIELSQREFQKIVALALSKSPERLRPLIVSEASPLPEGPATRY